MSDALLARRLPSVLLFSLVPVAAWFVVRPLIDPVPPLPALYVSVGFSIFALLATIYLVPALGSTFINANLKGRDLLKTYTTPMCVLPLSPDTVILANFREQTREHGARLRISIYSLANTIYSVCILPDFLEWVTGAIYCPRRHCHQCLPPLPSTMPSSLLFVKVNDNCSFPFTYLRFFHS